MSGKDWKMHLNNYCQGKGIDTPSYVEGHQGTKHGGTWVATVRVGDEQWEGVTAPTKIGAHNLAAEQALLALQARDNQ